MRAACQIFLTPKSNPEKRVILRMRRKGDILKAAAARKA